MADKQNIQITPELLEEARAAESAESIAAIAREKGIEMGAEEAEAVFAMIHGADGEIADEELDGVAGGGCGEPSRLECPACGAPYPSIIKRESFYDQLGPYEHITFECGLCRHTWVRSTF